MEKNKIFGFLNERVRQCGADKAAVIEADKLLLSDSFRELCASNAC